MCRTCGLALFWSFYLAPPYLVDCVIENQDREGDVVLQDPPHKMVAKRFHVSLGGLLNGDDVHLWNPVQNAEPAPSQTG